MGGGSFPGIGGLDTEEEEGLHLTNNNNNNNIIKVFRSCTLTYVRSVHQATSVGVPLNNKISTATKHDNIQSQNFTKLSG